MTSQFTPRYYEIEQALRARIADLGPGDALPSDSMLCMEFEVSRMTARNAVQRLAQEGLVERVPGRGTFVARSRSDRQASKLLSFSDEMRRRGQTPSSVVLHRVVRAPSPSERNRLRQGRLDTVFELTRLRLADDQPVALERAVLAAEKAVHLMDVDLERGSLHATLIAAGHTPTRGRATLSADVADAEHSELLAVDIGAPLFVERRLIFDQHDWPLEATESRYVASRYSLDVDFDVVLPEPVAARRRD